jgi:hypothetical protein
MLVLNLFANVVFPAAAGFVVTLQLLLPAIMLWFPSVQPSAAAMIPVSGLVTAMICFVMFAARRLIGRKTA